MDENKGIYKHNRMKYKIGDSVKFIERQYTVRSSKKVSMYGQPVYDIESILPNGIGDFLKYQNIPQSLLK